MSHNRWLMRIIFHPAADCLCRMQSARSVNHTFRRGRGRSLTICAIAISTVIYVHALYSCGHVNPLNYKLIRRYISPISHIINCLIDRCREVRKLIHRCAKFCNDL